MDSLSEHKSPGVATGGLLARDWIAGLERGLALIECFDQDNGRMTAQQVGDRCSLTRTAARRYLLTLQHLGYVATDGKHFWLTPRVMRLGQSYLASARLPRLAQPFLQRLSSLTQESSYLAVRDGDDIVYVARNGPNRAMNSGFVLGAHVPSHVTSAGMLMLAMMEPEALDEWLDQQALPAFTAYTIVDKSELREVLRVFRQQGWALSEQQFDLAIRGVAVPLRDLKGQVLGALSVSLPIQFESGADTVARVLPALQEAAQAMRNVV